MEIVLGVVAETMKTPDRRDRLLDQLADIEAAIARIKRTLADLEQRKTEIATQLDRPQE